jgi:CubicO group peptidase (beta-lactamase class C family)
VIDRRRFLQGATLGVGALATGGVLLEPSHAATSTRLDRFLQTKLHDSHCPGFGLAAVNDGDVVWSDGVGLARVAQEQPVRRDTMFMLASISKTFIVTALMQVWEQGGIDLDGDINDVLPFRVRSPAFPSTPITARQLLTHTSGIRDNWDVLIKTYTQGDCPMPLHTYMRQYLVKGGRFYYPAKNFTGRAPGTHYAYCNIGASLAADLVEAATGVDFAKWCEKRIFTPLGMSDTGWHLRDLDRHRIALPYTGRRSSQWKSHGLYGYPDYPDGALRTTAHSLAKFLAAYARDGGPILKPATVDLILSNQKITPGWQGLIWYRSKGPRGWLVGHSGGDYGVSTEMWFRQSDGAGAIVLANGGAYRGRDDMLDVRDRLIREAAHL